MENILRVINTNYTNSLYNSPTLTYIELSGLNVLYGLFSTITIAFPRVFLIIINTLFIAIKHNFFTRYIYHTVFVSGTFNVCCPIRHLNRYRKLCASRRRESTSITPTQWQYKNAIVINIKIKKTKIHANIYL